MPTCTIITTPHQYAYCHITYMTYEILFLTLCDKYTIFNKLIKFVALHQCRNKRVNKNINKLFHLSAFIFHGRMDLLIPTHNRVHIFSHTHFTSCFCLKTNTYEFSYTCEVIWISLSKHFLQITNRIFYMGFSSSF